MKKVFYIVFFTNLTFFSSLARANDAEQACIQAMTAPEITISTSYGNLQYDHSKSRRSITRLHLSRNKSGTLFKNLLNGLSTFEHSINFSAKLTKHTLPSGITCVYPSSVTLHFGTGEDPVIYVAREYEEDTCMYKLVLRHEQIHQQINQSVLEHYLPMIKQKFLEAVKNNVVVSKDYNISFAVAQEELKEKYLTILNPLLEEIKDKTKAEQNKLDRAENYDYETAICRETD